MEFTLEEMMVMEAAERGLAKTGRGKKFDPLVFKAVAKLELENLRLNKPQPNGR